MNGGDGIGAGPGSVGIKNLPRRSPKSNGVRRFAEAPLPRDALHLLMLGEAGAPEFVEEAGGVPSVEPAVNGR
jgi:hypothetical protein